MRRHNLIKVFMILSFISCKKPADPLPVTPVTPVIPIPPVTHIPSNLYFAGDTLSEFSSPPIPVYWKNDSAIALPDSVKYGTGTGIALSGNDIYVSSAGTVFKDNVTYWKNGNIVNPTDPDLVFRLSNAITVSGDDVYVAGTAAATTITEDRRAVVWKNNNMAIRISPDEHTYVRSIAVSGNDVYIAGASSHNFPTPAYVAATYWKNGERVYLATDKIQYNAIANSIFISGADVYVAGNINAVDINITDLTYACYWKNGVFFKLTATGASVANSIVVSGNDVYVAGGIAGSDGSQRATYWKNGIAVNLDSNSSVAQAIIVDGNNIYVAGIHARDSAAYWKNGKQVLLGRGHVYGMAIHK